MVQLGHIDGLGDELVKKSFSDIQEPLILLLPAAPVYYVKRIPDTEIRILGTVGNLRQERSSLVTSSPGVVIESEKSIEPESDKTLNKNVEESKRDVSLEELLNDNSQKRNKRINKDKNSVEKDTTTKQSPRTHDKSLHSTLGEYIVLMVSKAHTQVFRQRLSHNSTKAHAKMPISAMGSKRLALLGRGSRCLARRKKNA